MNPPLLQTEGLGMRMRGRWLFRDLNLKLRPGQCHALLGANGSGKTTLLHTLAGLRRPQEGAVMLGKEPMTRLPRMRIARSLGLLFQDAGEGFPGSVLETALMGRHPHLNAWGWETREDRDIARLALEQMELDGFLDRDNRALSGGERQRLALATLLTQQPHIALLDESTNHLDPGHQIRLLDRLLDTARTRDMAVMMSLHDPNLALRFCDRALLLTGDGQWIAGPTEKVITEGHMGRLYGHPMKAIEQDGSIAFIPV